jgi:DNA-binding CsgD family transcriptional regulator
MGAWMAIGRDRETARINRFLAGLPAGSGVLLIEGEAGIGKTTLLRESHDAAVQAGMTVLSASPVESEAPLEFAALADLLGTVPAALVQQLPLPQQRAIRQAVLRVEAQPGPADTRTIATALLGLLHGLAKKQTVLLVVDDLPWLDEPSARALSFALRRLRRDPVGLLAAVRTGWSGDQPPMAMDGIPWTGVDHLRLGPLNLDAIRELLATRIRLSPSRSLVSRLHEVSGGNPLFALELAARAHAGGAGASLDTLGTPDSLRRLVLGTVSGLPPGTRDVLLVSALSAEPAVPVICAATRCPATAHTDLEVGIRAGMLARADGDIAFVHPLMRSVVAAEARPGERRAAHRRLAAVVRGQEARARHLALAAGGPDEAVAAELETAARMAGHRGACDTAGDLAELAIALTPLAEPESRQRRVFLAAEQRFEASDPARACHLLESIAEAMPAGPGRAELWRRLARYRAVRGDPLSVWTAMLARALGEAGDDEELRALIMIDQAVAASNAGQLPEAIRLGEQALQLAGRVGDTALTAQCCAGLAFATFVLGNGLRQDLIGRALAGPEQSARLSVELRPNVAVGHVLHWAGDLDGARVRYEQEYARAVEQGIETGLPFLMWALAENEAWAGNWSRAEQVAAEGYRLAVDSGSLAAIAFMSASQGLLHVYRGRIDAGLRDASRATELARELGMPLLTAVAAQAFGVGALSMGDARTAHERLGPAAEVIRATGLTEPALCRFLPDEIEALTRLGELAAAEQLLSLFEARSAQLGRGWGIAAAGRCRGLLLAARGDMAGAAAALDAALTVHARVPMPFEEARTFLSAGEIQRRARHKHKARESLRAALAIFQRLGAPRWQKLVADELDRVGTRAAATAAGPDLTAAERRVADLAAAGRTNTEIAAELFMGQRTVEAHLYRAYRKLGVRSRTELCRMLVSPDQA